MWTFYIIFPLQIKQTNNSEYFENKMAILEQEYKNKLDQIKASQVDE